MDPYFCMPPFCPPESPGSSLVVQPNWKQTQECWRCIQPCQTGALQSRHLSRHGARIWRVLGVPPEPTSHDRLATYSLLALKHSCTLLCCVIWGFVPTDRVTWAPLPLASGRGQPVGDQRAGRERSFLHVSPTGLQLLLGGPPSTSSHGAPATLFSSTPPIALQTRGSDNFLLSLTSGFFNISLLFLLSLLVPLQIFPSSHTIPLNQYEWNPASCWDHYRRTRQQP